MRSADDVSAKTRKGWAWTDLLVVILVLRILATRCPTSPQPTINNLGLRNRAGNAPKPALQNVMAGLLGSL
jgi:hypothetical protein